MKPFAGEIERLDIPVSEAAPVKIFTYSYQKPAGATYDAHFGLELGIVLSGRLRQDYREHRRIIGPGQVWFCGMWEPHGGRISEAPCEIVVMVIWPPMLAQMRFAESPELGWLAPFTLKPADRPQVAPSNRKYLLEQALRLKKLADPATPLEKAQIRIGLLNILTMVLGRSDFEPNSAGPHPAYWEKLNRAAQLVYENKKFISTSAAAKECGLNRFFFSRLFKGWMGLKFSDFAVSFRLKQSVVRLLNGNEPVKSVARQWGFVDTSHYNRIFRKYYGCSPSEYRRKPRLLSRGMP